MCSLKLELHKMNTSMLKQAYLKKRLQSGQSAVVPGLHCLLFDKQNLEKLFG